MVWFKVDDNLAFHQKTLQAGNAAMGLWVRAGSWCAQQLTDGFIPREMARSLGSKQEADRLVAARLWLQRDDGYDFWQWGEDGRQPTRAEVEEKRKESRERQRRAREKAAASRAASQRDSTSDIPSDRARDDAVSHDSPDPTRPLSTLAPDEPTQKKTRQRDELFDALAEVCGIDVPGMTESSRGAFTRALKDLRAVDATPNQVKVRARRYREKFTNAPLTAPALAKHWPSLNGAAIDTEDDAAWARGGR